MLLVIWFAFLLALGRCAKLPDRPPGGRAVPRDQSLQRLVSRMLGETTMGGGGLDDRAPWELDNDDTYIELDLARSHAIAAARQHMHMLQEAQDAARLHLWQRAAPRIVMVSNRLPISVKRGPGGKLEFSVSSGGMVSALLGVEHMRRIWVGWADLEDATPEEMQEVRRHMLRRGCVPVFLDKPLARGYYNGFCNDVLWPLFHYVSRSPEGEQGAAGLEQEQWESYRLANAKFADAVASVARSKDVVWVHDYHLMLLPSLLRERQPRLRIGWFLHTPWPSSEVFRMLPMRRELLQGLLGADLLGFHIYEYARHFLHACTNLLGRDVTLRARHISWDRPLPDSEGGGVKRHAVRVDAFPIGIDPQRFERGVESPKVRARIAELQAQFDGMQVLLGVDRLDYIKGIPQKLLAIESLLEQHPEMVGKVCLLQIAVPTRTDVPEYQKLRATAHRIVGRINGRFGSVGYVPIHYLDKSVEFDELCALYYISSACVVTSLRDGMNLVSYEYVACQGGAPAPTGSDGVVTADAAAAAAEGADGAADGGGDGGGGGGGGGGGAPPARATKFGKGVLVLSEFAGAAQALGAGCVRVNPYNTEEVARGMYDALTMGAEQRSELHAYAQQYVSKFTAQLWFTNFVAQLARTENEHADDRKAHAPPLPPSELLAQYSAASRRLIVLGVGGTFLPSTEQIAYDYDHASLSDEQCAMLRRLLRDPANTVVLASGRSRVRMDALLDAVLLREEDKDAVLQREQDGTGEAEAEAEAEGDGDGDGDGDGECAKAAAADAPDAAAAADGEESGDGGGGGEVDGDLAVLRSSLWGLAEGGVFTRRGWSAEWETSLQAAQEASWLEVAQEVFDYFEERTPESRVSRRECTIRWSYAAADHELGARHAALLVEHLEKVLVSAPVEMVWEGTFVEVRPYGTSMGFGLMQLLEADDAARGSAAAERPDNGDGADADADAGAEDEDAFDFVLCLGNFTARDEDIFTKVHGLFSPATGPEGDGDDAGRRDGDAEIEVDELSVELGDMLPDLEAGDDDAGDDDDDDDDDAEDAERAMAAVQEVAEVEAAEVEEVEEVAEEAPRLAATAEAEAEMAEEAEADGAASTAEAEAEAEAETEAETEAPNGVGITATLGNHTTHAHYFVAGQPEAEELLRQLAGLPQVPAKRRAAPSAAARAALSDIKAGGRLKNAMELSQLQIIQDRLEACMTPAFCLDYDGTLAPMVADPAAARLPKGVSKLLRKLSDRHPTAIVSGRSLEKLQEWVKVRGLYFAGSHGFEIVGPNGSSLNYTVASQLLPEIRDALRLLHAQLAQVPGAQLEDNKYALSVHTRNVSRADLPRLDALVQSVLEEQPLLRRSEGKHVIELKPQVNWNKGRAVEWLLKSMCEQLGLPSGKEDRNATAMPIYIGDDVADEDAFAELNQGRGVPIVVRQTAPLRNETAAEFYLRDTTQVAEFLSLFLHERSLVVSGRRRKLPRAQQEAPLTPADPGMAEPPPAMRAAAAESTESTYS